MTYRPIRDEDVAPAGTDGARTTRHDYLMTIAEVAEQSRTPIGSVRAWLRPYLGEPPRLHSIRPGRKRMVWRSDFLALMRSE